MHLASNTHIIVFQQPQEAPEEFGIIPCGDSRGCPNCGTPHTGTQVPLVLGIFSSTYSTGLPISGDDLLSVLGGISANEDQLLNLFPVCHGIDPLCPALDEFCLSVNNHISFWVFLITAKPGSLATRCGVHVPWGIQESLSPFTQGCDLRFDLGCGLVCFQDYRLYLRSGTPGTGIVASG